MLSERPCAFPYIVAHELSRFEKHFRSVVLNLAVLSAHNARKRDGLVSVADNEVFAVEREFVSVERGNLFAVFRSADINFRARKRSHIECVHRLT